MPRCVVFFFVFFVSCLVESDMRLFAFCFSQHFSAVLANRYHPVGDFDVALSGAKNNEQSLESRVEIAAKW